MKLLLYTLLIFISLTSICQENSIIQIGKNNLGALYNATGAHMYSDNHWESKPNKIPNNLNSSFHPSKNENQSSIDNFIFYQIKPININGVNHFIFIKKYIDEKLTSTNLDNSICISYIIFDSIKFTKYPSLNLDTITYIEFKSYSLEKIKHINKDSSYVKYITQNISKTFNSNINCHWATLFYFKLYKKTSQIQFMNYMGTNQDNTSLFDSCFYHTNIVQFKNLFGFNADFINLLTTPEIDNLTEVYTIADEMPQYPGGRKELTTFLRKNVSFYRKSFLRGMTGKCEVNFIINTDGKISDIKVTKPIEGYPEIGLELLRAIYTMPHWIPGKQNNIPVPVYYTISVDFGER